MKDLKADPDYLRVLAERQRSAANAVHDVTSDVDFMRTIAWSHGLYVRAGVNGIWDAVDERARAGEAMKKFSESLADRLEKGAFAYEATDERNAGEVGNEMRND